MLYTKKTTKIDYDIEVEENYFMRTSHIDRLDMFAVRNGKLWFLNMVTS